MNYLSNEGFWNRIAMIAGIFACIICILLIANYIQFKRADPVNMNVLNSLVERLNQNPDDKQLREEIRTLDLLARKAFFTEQWQIRVGGYLLIAGIAVMLIALQIINLNKKKKAFKRNKNEEYIELTKKKSRIAVALSGALLLIITIVIAFLSYNELGKKFKVAAIQSSVNPDISGQSEVSSQKSAVSNEHSAATNEHSVASNEQSTVSNQQSEASGHQSTVSNQQSTNEINLKSKIVNRTSEVDNYPTFRGPGGYGIAPQKNIPVSWDGAKGINILWKTAIPLPGNNSPVIHGDKLFLTGANATDREVYCIDKSSGKMLWTFPVKNIQGSPPVAPKVTDEAGFSASTAATDDKGVYAIFSNGDMVAIDMNGRQLWSHNFGMPQNHYGYASSLEIYKDMVFVQYDQRTSPKLMALSTITGKIVWSTLRQVKISWASPIIAFTGKRTEIIVSSEPYVASYNPDTGQELWKLDCISGEVAPSLAYSNEIVFSANDNSKLTAIRLGEQPKVLWESTEYLPDVPSPVATDRYLFIVTGYGTVVCYDAQTGTKYWEHDFNKDIFSSPVIAEGKVYLLDRDGKMHIFKADKEFSSIEEPKLGEKTVATPAFSNGHIYIRGIQNLYCIGKSSEQ